VDRILLIKRKGTNLRYFSIVNQNNMLIGPEKEKNSCVLARYKRKHIIMEKETIISCSLIFIKAYSRNGSAYCILSNAEIYLEHTHTACVHPHTCLPTLHTHTHTHTHTQHTHTHKHTHTHTISSESKPCIDPRGSHSIYPVMRMRKIYDTHCFVQDSSKNYLP